MLRNLVFVAFFAITTPCVAQDFNGYACTDDCSGHEAGYDWAENNDVKDENDCDNDSQSFMEGCLAYIGHARDLDAAERLAIDEEADASRDY